VLADIQQEFADRFIGPLILERVSSLVAKTVRAGGYRADVYADEASWTEEALRDLTQEVVTVQFIEERQLDYVMNRARSISDFDGLVRRQIRQQLRRRRTRSVVDNLVDRARDVLSHEPFVAEKVGRRVLYSMAGMSPERRAPTEIEVRSAAQRAALIPRIPARGVETRAPVVYSAENLRLLLETVARALPAHFSLTEIRSILDLLLTDLVASNLSPVWQDNEASQELPTTEGGGPLMAERALRPEQQALVSSAADPLWKALSSVQRSVLRGKLAGAADADIARELGISRPTIIKRKTEALAILSDHLGGLEESVQMEIISELRAALAAEGRS
jgi:DNA-binding transcriptional MerR regulator